LKFSKKEFIFNPLKYLLIFIIFLNIYIFYKLDIDKFDQLLNLLISFGVLNFFSEYKYKNRSNLNILSIFSSILLLVIVLYRSFWLYSEDNFVYFLFPILYMSLVILYFPMKNVIKNYKPILISFLLPITKSLFIPLSIIFSPLSSFFTWILLNALGFFSTVKGQQIFYNDSGINVTFSCSGVGQILFSLSAMIILNFCFPLRNIRIFICQLFIAFLFTFLANILRLFLLTLYVHTANSEGFSMFDYLHGGSGGLIFGFLSMTLSCESYKRFYFGNDISNAIN